MRSLTRGVRPAIDEVRLRGDSCGGEVTCVVRRCPKGIGAPVFDKLEAELAKALMSLPATKARAQCLAVVALRQTRCVSVRRACHGTHAMHMHQPSLIAAGPKGLAHAPCACGA
jgi:hypothetical protein